MLNYAYIYLRLFIGEVFVTLSQAVAKRIKNLLKEKNITQYRLEQNSGILHGTMQCIMNGRTSKIMMNTVMMIARGFDMTLIEFIDDDLFRSNELEIE